MDIELLRTVALYYLILLIAITMHEFGHAFVADRMGDKLPRLQGRVTLNPLAHMELFGTFILPLLTMFLSLGSGLPFIFGWGKPVQVFLDNPKTRTKVDLCSTAGGVSMNLIVALISAILAGILFAFEIKAFAEVAILSVKINCVLFIINMLPIPPLDGSHFLKYLTGMSSQTYNNIAKWGILIFLVILNVPFTSAIIFSLVNLLIKIYMYITVFTIGALSGVNQG